MKICLKIAPLVLLVGICLQLSCAAPISTTPIDTVSELEEFDFAGTASAEENLYTGTLTDTDTETVSYDEHREADEASFYSPEPESSDLEEETDDEIDTDAEEVEETDDDIVTDTEETDDDDDVITSDVVITSDE